LVRKGRIGIAIAEHQRAFFHRRSNDVGQVLRAAGEVEKELASRVDSAIAGVQQDGADLLADRRAPRLTGLNHQIPLRSKPVRESAKLRSLPAALNALKT